MPLREIIYTFDVIDYKINRNYRSALKIIAKT